MQEFHTSPTQLVLRFKDCSSLLCAVDARVPHIPPTTSALVHKECTSLLCVVDVLARVPHHPPHFICNVYYMSVQINLTCFCCTLIQHVRFAVGTHWVVNIPEMLVSWLSVSAVFHYEVVVVSLASIIVDTLQVDYIHVMEMTCNNFCTVLGLPDMTDDFKELCKDATPVVYHDTMFCMGDFCFAVNQLLYTIRRCFGFPTYKCQVLPVQKFYILLPKRTCRTFLTHLVSTDTRHFTKMMLTV